MKSEIVKTLGLMCDKNNPQDKKMLLLAELVDTKYETLTESHADIKKSVNETNKKLDKLTTLLEQYGLDRSTCPVYKNKEGFEQLTIFMKHPKISLFTILGVFAFLSGIFSSSVIDLLKFLFGI